jgi:hypothetical protein
MQMAQTKGSKSFDDGSAEFSEALAEAQKYLTMPHDEIDFENLPLEFSWEDINGYDFTGPV